MLFILWDTLLKFLIFRYISWTDCLVQGKCFLSPYFRVTLHIMVLQVSILKDLEANIGNVNHLSNPASLQSSSPGESHPQALTETGMNLSAHPALHVPSLWWGLYYSQVPPISGWPICNFGHVTPLLSISITEVLSLLRSNPPLCSVSVLSFLWGFHLNFSLSIGTTASHVPYESLIKDHATFMPDTT